MALADTSWDTGAYANNEDRSKVLSIVNAQEQDYVVSCSSKPLLFPKQTLSKDTKNLDISAIKSKKTLSLI
jgi:hypothetical protein